ncbi:MAG: hypothetical protein AAF380_02855, partial [Bacteroidota bacterium]
MKTYLPLLALLVCTASHASLRKTTILQFEVEDVRQSIKFNPNRFTQPDFVKNKQGKLLVSVEKKHTRDGNEEWLNIIITDSKIGEKRGKHFSQTISKFNVVNFLADPGLTDDYLAWNAGTHNGSSMGADFLAVKITGKDKDFFRSQLKECLENKPIKEDPRNLRSDSANGQGNNEPLKQGDSGANDVLKSFQDGKEVKLTIQDLQISTDKSKMSNPDYFDPKENNTISISKKYNNFEVDLTNKNQFLTYIDFVDKDAENQAKRKITLGEDNWLKWEYHIKPLYSISKIDYERAVQVQNKDDRDALVSMFKEAGFTQQEGTFQPNTESQAAGRSNAFQSANLTDHTLDIQEINNSASGMPNAINDNQSPAIDNEDQTFEFKIEDLLEVSDPYSENSTMRTHE